MNCFRLIALVLVAGCASSSSVKPMTDLERAQTLNQVAAANIQEGDPTSALINLEDSLKLAPDQARTHLLLAITYFKKNEMEQAINSAKKAVELDPGFSEAKNTLGRLLMDSGRGTEAEKPLREAAADLKSSNSFIARTNLGILYYRQGKLDQSISEFTRVLTDEPKNGCMAAYYRGQVYLLKNNLPLAKKDFETSSKSACVGFTAARLSLGKTLIKLGEKDLARAKLVELKQLFPDSSEAEQATEILKEIP